MEDDLILISQLNDFVFCPVSVYFHQLYDEQDHRLFQSTDQTSGKTAHRSIDEQSYSSSRKILAGRSVYCEKYGLVGKIDLFYSESGLLVERKKKIYKIYDGYVFQLYGQYFSLMESGIEVKAIALRSLDDNKSYPIQLPEKDPAMFAAFESLISAIRTFNMDHYTQTDKAKCGRCVYEPLCDRSLL